MGREGFLRFQEKEEDGVGPAAWTAQTVDSEGRGT